MRVVDGESAGPRSSVKFLFLHNTHEGGRDNGIAPSEADRLQDHSLEVKLSGRESVELLFDELKYKLLSFI